jgi:hypothetical protein
VHIQAILALLSFITQEDACCACLLLLAATASFWFCWWFSYAYVDEKVRTYMYVITDRPTYACRRSTLNDRQSCHFVIPPYRRIESF